MRNGEKIADNFKIGDRRYYKTHIKLDSIFSSFLLTLEKISILFQTIRIYMERKVCQEIITGFINEVDTVTNYWLAK